MANTQTSGAAGGFSNIAVIGFGLIGASFAASVRSTWPDVNVLAVDVDARTRAEALSRGWATQDACGADDPKLSAFLENGCDLVVLAVPVGFAEEYLSLIARVGYAGIVTDVSSTKSRIVALAEKTLSRPRNFVPGHPMAGSERNGIDGAREGLFKGAYWILCPDSDTPAEHFTRLHELVTGLGARVISLPREQHDNAVAIVSHVPHVVASSLVELASRHADRQQSLMRLAAGGFKDTTRIAAGSPALWCGISFDNKDAIVAGLKEFQGIVGQFVDALESDDRAGLTDLLAEAAGARRALPAAWVPSTERLLEVRVPMRDHPGAVAEVTAITSNVGCNIQSIEIDHVTESSAVLSLVLTDEGDFGKLSSHLIDAGYSVSLNPLSPKEHIHVD